MTRETIRAIAGGVGLAVTIWILVTVAIIRL